MTNEIKEILDMFYNEYPKEEKIIEKYITNLQEDLANYVNVVLHNRKIIDNLQQRINKAIKKIEKDAELIDLEDGYYTCMAVIDILRGDE